MGIFGNSEERDARRTAQIEERNLELERQERLKVHRALVAEHVKDSDKRKSRERAESAPKWEYLVVDDIEEDKLDAFGSIGWELVNINSYATGGGIGGNSVMKVHFRSVFKRPLLETYSDTIPALDKEIERLRDEGPHLG